MFEKLKRKLHTSKGFSLAEMLMTVAIMSVVIVGVTTGIATVSRSYGKIVRKSNAITLLSTLTTAMNADLKYATDIKTNSDGEVTSFYSFKRNVVMNYDTMEEDGQNYIYIDYIDTENGKTTVSVPVITKSIYTDELTVEIEEPLTYHFDDESKNEEGYFTYKLAVYRKNKDSGEKALIAQDYSVRTAATDTGD